MQIIKYPQTSVVPQYVEFESNNKVRVHTSRLVLWLPLVQLSWRVTPPILLIMIDLFSSCRLLDQLDPEGRVGENYIQH